MYHPYYQPLSRGLSSTSAQQNKVILQRVYREKEVECFKTLRSVIKDLTGREPRTRQDILQKAIDILLSAAESHRKQNKIQWEVNGIPSAMPSPTALLLGEDMTSTYVASTTNYSIQSPHWFPNLRTSAESDASPNPYDQQCYSAAVPSTCSALESGGAGFSYWYNHSLGQHSGQT